MSEGLHGSAVQNCPYCADEDLWPVEEPTGAWQCRACARVFVVRLVAVDAAQIPGRVREEAELRGSRT